MERTANYDLNKWEKTDRIEMEDFNEDNRKIDEALAEQAAELSTQALKLAKCGNCQFWTTTYTGTGTYGSDNKTSVTFPSPPLLVGVFSIDGMAFFTKTGGYGASGSSVSSLPFSWTGNTLSYYSSRDSQSQYNYLGHTYTVVALLTIYA